MINRTSIYIQNLKCGGCAHTITTKLGTLENITDLHVDTDENKVSFSYLNEADVFTVKERLKDLGYPSLEDSNSLTSKAKSFVSCATGKLSK